MKRLFIAIFVVYDVKDTKFEWNSQRLQYCIGLNLCCLWCQRYKIWMELTTCIILRHIARKLFMMSKIQNLNGTHNNPYVSMLIFAVVYDVKDTKFEWNSQLFISCDRRFQRCLWCQRYKIWMELTTADKRIAELAELFMMSKIQNLNGTHN